MPWRVPPHAHARGKRADPYHVWLSEVMLQQTQVATVRDYYLKFIRKWPSIEDLAKSDEDDVLTAWAGLGYYSRARNLKKCANVVTAEHNGEFPRTADSLKKLPGIGDYTAASIAAIAFDQPVAVIDGNVERVMARHERIDELFPAAKSIVRGLLATLLDPEKPGEFAQAMMDLGATICTPKRPACGICPLNAECKSAFQVDVETFPRKKPKTEKPERKGAAYVIENQAGEIFLCKRGGTGLLAGMTQVPTTDWNARSDGKTDSLAAPVSAKWRRMLDIRHTFTHFHLDLVVWHARSEQAPAMDGWWCPIDRLSDEALPTVMRKVLASALA